MTNEEKAREIATTNHDEYVDKKDSLYSLAICEKSALEMANWKDKQLKFYIEKRIDDCIARMNTPWYKIIQHIKLSRELYELSRIMTDLGLYDV